jgi:hypothetical protein
MPGEITFWPELVDPITGLRLYLSNNPVGVALSPRFEASHQVADMVIAPFDL